MSMPKYPNRDALRKANDIYLDAMRPFIVHHLKQVQGEKVENLIEDALDLDQADKFWEKLDEDDDTESAIDFSYFPQIIQRQWKNAFGQRFNWDLNFQSMLWLIRKGRNSCEHRGKKDLDSESVRMNLLLIADVLGKINKPDEQREVENIRDELFSDDTKERLAEAEERLKDVEAENAEYKKSLSETEERLTDAEAKNSKYEKDTAELSKQVDEKENRIKKLLKQQKEAKAQNEKSKKDLARTKRSLEKSEAAQTDYKQRLKTISKEARASEENLKMTSHQLKEAVDEWMASVECLTVIRKLFTAATIGSQEIQKMFPSFETNSAVRILDRRNTEKKNYLLNLLEQKQPTLIYVQSEEMVNKLLTLVGPEKAAVIRKRNAQTSTAEDAEILEKLGKGELVAIVSDTTFSTSIPSHCVEHFVFCHLAPSSDAFFDRCQPAFTSKKDTYLHLIYNSEQDMEALVQKYPDREVLEKMYPELRKLAETNGNFIKIENLYSKLDIAKLSIETGLAIFEELQLLARNGENIKLLPPTGKKLDESEAYRRGEELKKEASDFRTFQLEHSIEQIWEAILEKLNVDSKQILRKSEIHSKHFKISEKDNYTQSTTETEQNRVIPPIPDVWPQRGMSAFNALRQQAANTSDDLWVREDPEGEDTLSSPLVETEYTKDHRNRYDLAMQFAQEHGIKALEEGVAQLIKDRNDPDYNFTIDEMKMLRAFQEALKDSQTQPKQSTEVVEKDSAVSQATKGKAREKKPSIVERYTSETTEADRDEVAVKVVEMRINAAGSKGMSWRRIREKLGLRNDEFHKVIRLSKGYRKAVIDRIKQLKSRPEGWEYSGKLEVLTGIELSESELS